MAQSGTTLRGVLIVLLAGLLTTACAQPPPHSQNGEPAQSQTSGHAKVVNLGLRTILDAFSIAASPTLAGGGLGYIEIHSQALFTADQATGRPIPRLLAEQPTLDNGGLRVNPDGTMVATYKLRRDVQWADGAPFNTKDLMFTFALSQDKSMPVVDPGPTQLMESASAPDDYTFVISWKQPYYQADALGLQPFWPLPAHLLEADYQRIVVEQKDVNAFFGKPYWTSEYLHIGPFKLVDWIAGSQATFEAVDNYFLGRPKVDRIVVKQFPDDNALLASILAGAVDLSTDSALQIEAGVQLKDVWAQNDGGTIWFVNGNTWFAAFQFERTVPGFCAPLLDVRVRQALYQAIDRDAESEAVQAGIADRAAYVLLSPGNPLYSYVKDTWKQRYPYDPARASATLEAAGWRKGADGVLANSAGEKLSFPSWTTQGQERKVAIVADMWRQLGADIQEYVIPAARVRDPEFRQSYPAVEITARGNEDVLLTRLEGLSTPTSQNHFAGNNRGHWKNDTYDRLTNQYRASLREQERGTLIGQLQDIMIDELPIGLLHYEVGTVLVRKGVNAFRDDIDGGASSGRIYGTYSRNAHLWDVTA